MTISELIAHLAKLREEHGDLEVFANDPHECDKLVTEDSVWFSGDSSGCPGTIWIQGDMKAREKYDEA